MGMTGGAGAAIEMLLVDGGVDDDELTPDLFEPAVPVGLPPAARPAATDEPRSGPKGGRPKGARNKSTQAWVRYLGSRYQSPLVGLAEMWSRSPRQLAEDLELYKWHEGKPVVDAGGRQVLDTGAAAAMQLQARIAALPYWHQRLPLAVEVKSEQLGVMLIGSLDVPGQAATTANDDVPTLLIEPEENQQVSDADPDGSHA